MRGFLLFLGALSLLGLFAGLDRGDFADDREARDAAIARETMARRDLLRPVLGGEAQTDKPLLGYAHEMLGASLTPRSPAGARAVKAVAVVLLVGLTGWIGVRHLGARAGAFAATVLATTLALPLAARSDGTQVVATLLGWIAALAFADVLLRAAPPSRLAIAYPALGAALVIAGPLPALWPLAGLALGLWWTRAGHLWRRLHPLAGALAIAGLALPWYGAMTERLGPDFLWRALAFPYGSGPAAPWYAAPARALGFLAVGFFPWTTLLPEAALRAGARPAPWMRGGSASGASAPPAGPTPNPIRFESLLLGWLTAGALAMPLLPSAPLTAALPALPAAALLIGKALEGVFDHDPVWGRALAQASLLLAVTGTAAATLLAMAAARIGEGAPELRLVSAFLLLACWGPALAVFLRRPAAAAALFALPVALGAPLVFRRMLPALEDYMTALPVAEAFAATAPAGAPLLVLGPIPPSLRLHAGSHLVEPENLARGLRDLPRAGGFAYVAFRPAREREVARAAAPFPIEILMRTPAWALARVEGKLP